MVGQRRLLSSGMISTEMSGVVSRGPYCGMDIFWWVREHTSCVIHFCKRGRFLDEDTTLVYGVHMYSLGTHLSAPTYNINVIVACIMSQSNYEYYWRFLRETC